MNGERKSKKATHRQHKVAITKLVSQNLQAVQVIKNMQEVEASLRLQVDTANDIIEGALDNEIRKAPEWKEAVKTWQEQQT